MSPGSVKYFLRLLKNYGKIFKSLRFKKDYPIFSTTDQVTTNAKGVNGLTQTLKTDNLFNRTTFFDTEQEEGKVLLIDETKKIKDNTTYSKIKI